MYSHFVSYLKIYSTEDDQIHSGATQHVAYPILSLPCLLMPWQFKEPRHQQAWYRPQKLEYSISSIRKVNTCVTKASASLTPRYLLCKITWFCVKHDHFIINYTDTLWRDISSFSKQYNRKMSWQHFFFQNYTGILKISLKYIFAMLVTCTKRHIFMNTKFNMYQVALLLLPYPLVISVKKRWSV